MRSYIGFRAGNIFSGMNPQTKGCLATNAVPSESPNSFLSASSTESLECKWLRPASERLGGIAYRCLDWRQKKKNAARESSRGRVCIFFSAQNVFDRLLSSGVELSVSMIVVRAYVF